MDTNHEPKIVELKLVLSKHQQEHYNFTNEKILDMFRTEKLVNKRKMEVWYGVIENLETRIYAERHSLHNLGGLDIVTQFSESFATVNDCYIRNDELFVELELNPNFNQDINFLGYVKGMYWKSNIDYGTILETVHWEDIVNDKEDMFTIKTLESWVRILDSNVSGFHILNFGIMKKIIYKDLMELAKLHDIEY